MTQHDGVGSEAFRCIKEFLGGPAACTPLDPGWTLGAQSDEPVLTLGPARGGHLGSGETVTYTVDVDTSDNSLVSLTYLTGTLAMTIAQPNGTIVTPAYAEANSGVVTYTQSGGGGPVLPFVSYAFTNTIPGPHVITIAAVSLGSEGTDYVLETGLESTRRLSVTVGSDLLEIGETLSITGTLLSDGSGVPGATVTASFSHQDGLTDTLLLSEQGNGVYLGNYVVPNSPGPLTVRISAVGNDNGTDFEREGGILLGVAGNDIQLSGSFADRAVDEDNDGTFDTLDIDVGINATGNHTVTLLAQINKDDAVIGHTAIYTAVAQGVQTITLHFQGEEIAALQADGPYTLTNVVIGDDEAGVLGNEHNDLYMTSAYSWSDFGTGGTSSIYLPAILKNPECAPMLLFRDDFSNPDSGWPTENLRASWAGYASGEYLIDFKDNGWIVWEEAPGSYDDYIVKVDARFADASSTGSYGLVFGMSDDLWSHYFLEVRTDNTGGADEDFYRLGTRQGDTRTYLTGWLGTGLGGDSTAPYQLEVHHVDSQIDLFATYDGVRRHLRTVYDDRFMNNGRVGVFAYAQSGDPTDIDVYFDNFEVRQVICK
jgi:hypothetical protein